MAREAHERTVQRRIERALADAGLAVIVTDAGATIRLDGLVDTEEARQAASDVVAAIAPDRPIENNLEVETILPLSTTAFRSDAPAAGDLPDTLDEALAGGSDFEPDFTDQELETGATEMAGEASATDDPDLDDQEVFFPPTDPVVTLDDQNEVQMLGGFAPTSMDEIEVEPSALDGQPGDEALADAIRRELREDALTTDLRIRVIVRNGVAHLRGSVPSLDDAESAEEVAGRIPGVREVVEELDVAGL
jgi:osmotically-inducible protein OsmY